MTLTSIPGKVLIGRLGKTLEDIQHDFRWGRSAQYLKFKIRQLAEKQIINGNWNRCKLHRSQKNESWVKTIRIKSRAMAREELPK